MKDSLPKLAPEQDAAPGLRAYSRGNAARKRLLVKLDDGESRLNPS